MKSAPFAAHPPTATDGGESLLELVIAVAIMGIAVVAIVSGVATSILMSDTYRKQATAGTYVRDYAEALENYVAGGGYNATSPSYGAVAVGFTVPSSLYVASVSSVTCWDEATAKFVVTCPTTTSVQQVALTVVSSGVSEGLVVIVRQP